MKRKILTFALVLTAFVPVGAQTMYDGYTFASADYFGTAKAMGLGGAVTALGGDLGTIGINPAGSAVAGYSQFTVTPALSLSIGDASYAASSGAPYAGADTRLHPRFKAPNIGASFRFDTGYSGKLRSWTIGFVANTVSDYNSSFRTGGLNTSSKFAEMAAAAGGISPSVLGSDSFYDNSQYSNYWDVALGYNVGLISGYGNESDNKYVGCTEIVNDSGEHWVPGDLRHTSAITHYGYKTDMAFNFGFNYSDNFFLGFNIGMPVIEYSNVETWSETALNPDLFPTKFTFSDGTEGETTFSDAAYRYNYNASATGIYFKTGLIWLPTSYLRFGLAYQTRTSYSVTETWQHSGQVSYTNSVYSASGQGQRGTYEYTFHSPSVLDAGVAVTFGRRGLLSFDYELKNYGRMRFEERQYDDYGYSVYSSGDVYSDENTLIKTFNAPSHNFRVGAELNLTRDFALRCGAGLFIGPEVYYKLSDGSSFTYSDYDDDYFTGRKNLDGLHKHYYTNWEDLTCNASLGFGYNPTGSFFADFAVRLAKYPDSVYTPYADYTDMNGYTVSAPHIYMERKLVSALLTFGWRF